MPNKIRTNQAVVARYLANQADSRDTLRAQSLIANAALRLGLAQTWEEAKAGKYLENMSEAEHKAFVNQL